MMEWWNIGSKIPSLAGLFLKGNISSKNPLIIPLTAGPIHPVKFSGGNHILSRFSWINHYSIIPLFLPRETSSYFTGANIPIGAKPPSSSIKKWLNLGKIN
jgi:hypothetical protein